MSVKQVNDAKLRVRESSRQHAIDIRIWRCGRHNIVSPTPKLTSPTTRGNNNKFGSAGQYTDSPQGVCVCAQKPSSEKKQKKTRTFGCELNLNQGPTNFSFLGKHQKNVTKWKMFRPPSSFRQTTAIIDYRTSQTTVRALHNPNYHAQNISKRKTSPKKRNQKVWLIGLDCFKKTTQTFTLDTRQKEISVLGSFSVTQLSN